MIFKIVCSNKDNDIVIGEDELDKAINSSSKNQPAIFRQGVVLNWNMYSGIVPHKEKNAEISEFLKYGKNKEEAEREVLGISPFAKLISGKMKMLSDQSRTSAQEESAIEDRRLK